jgi:eukaryotic-like serine/threonine-protein kinase
VDARTDLYSLGAVLFEMLTGEPLFSGPTPQAILAKRAAEPTPSRARLTEVPSALRDVVERALAADSADRFSTAAEFRAAVTAAMGKTGNEPPRASRGGWRSWLGLG